MIDSFSQRTAPADVMARLREIEPTAELVYLGAGHWLLGSVRPTRVREREGCRAIGRWRQLPEEKRSPGRLLRAQLIRQGFAPIELYEVNDPDGRIVRDFRRRDWRWRNRADETFERTLDNSDDAMGLHESIETIIDQVHAEWRGLHAFSTGRRRHFTH